MLPSSVLIKGHIMGLCLLKGYVDIWLMSFGHNLARPFFKVMLSLFFDQILSDKLEHSQQQKFMYYFGNSQGCVLGSWKKLIFGHVGVKKQFGQKMSFQKVYSYLTKYQFLYAPNEAVWIPKIIDEFLLFRVIYMIMPTFFLIKV